jgi:hypothetical protein
MKLCHSHLYTVAQISFPWFITYKHTYIEENSFYSAKLLCTVYLKEDL